MLSDDWLPSERPVVIWVGRVKVGTRQHDYATRAADPGGAGDS